jgi:hypothetical protein
LGLRNTEDLILRTVDAATIPSVFDVPIQRIRLYDIGMLSLILGFSSVEINISSRNFNATGPFGTITTEDFPNFGKVLRFEGDIFNLYRTISRCDRVWLYVLAPQIVGRLSLGNFVSFGNVLPLQMIKEAVSEYWSSDHYEFQVTSLLKGEKDGYLLSHLPREASFFQELTELTPSILQRNTLQGEVASSSNLLQYDHEVLSSNRLSV